MKTSEHGCRGWSARGRRDRGLFGCIVQQSAPSPSALGGNGEASKSSSQVCERHSQRHEGTRPGHIAGDVNQNGQDITVGFVLSHTVVGIR